MVVMSGWKCWKSVAVTCAMVSSIRKHAKNLISSDGV